MRSYWVAGLEPDRTYRFCVGYVRRPDGRLVTLDCDSVRTLATRRRLDRRPHLPTLVSVFVVVVMTAPCVFCLLATFARRYRHRKQYSLPPAGSSVRRSGSSLDRVFDVPEAVWIECSTYRKQYSKVTKCLCLQLPPVGSSVRRPRPVDALCPAAGGQSEPPSGEVENRACGVEVAGNVGNGREEVSGRRRQRALERTLLRGDDGGDVDISPIPLDSLYDLPSTSLSAATSQSSLITHA